LRLAPILWRRMRGSGRQFRPLAEMNCRAMKDVAVANWEAKGGAHREEADEGEEEVLRHPKFAEVEILIGECAWRECRVVSIHHGCENYLLKSSVEVIAQRVHFLPDVSRIAGGKF
jgi:hypothetical protein